MLLVEALRRGYPASIIAAPRGQISLPGRQARTVREMRASSKPDRGVLILDVAVRNQRGETVCQAEWTTLMTRRRGTNGSTGSATATGSR